MSPTFALLLTFAAADPDGPLTVHPTRGQELVYRGRFTEESRSGPSPDRRQYDLEARAFVLDAADRGAEVAFLTVLRASGAAPDAPGSARLEVADVAPNGRVTLRTTGRPPPVPLDGLPSLESAPFVELPAGRIDVGVSWDTADGSRPPLEWRVEEADFRNGARCLKVVGSQQSGDWDRPTGDALAWRRVDVVWLAIQSGTVLRLERTVERRAGGDGSAGGVGTTEYELAESFTYPDQLATDRRREITQADQFNQSLAALLPRAGRVAPPAQFQSLLARIDHHVATLPATPYRPAVVAARRRAEAGMKGEAPPTTDAPDPPTAPPTVGRPAPDFVTTDLVSGTPVRLARWRGRPVVLLFVRPDASAASATLTLARQLQARHGDKLRVAVLVVTDEDRARPAWAEFGVPLLAGRDVAAMYGVGGASRAIAIDSAGLVRHAGETGAVAEVLQQLVER